MFRYLKKKLFRRNRYKGLKKDNAAGVEPLESKGTDSNNRIKSETSHPSLFSFGKSEDTVTVSPVSSEDVVSFGCVKVIINVLYKMNFWNRFQYKRFVKLYFCMLIMYGF